MHSRGKDSRTYYLARCLLPNAAARIEALRSSKRAFAASTPSAAATATAESPNGEAEATPAPAADGEAAPEPAPEVLGEPDADAGPVPAATDGALAPASEALPAPVVEAESAPLNAQKWRGLVPELLGTVRGFPFGDERSSWSRSGRSR